jgi:exopolysaccharide biosynthesis polyprenyl glycosylphosphotransferase
LIFASLNYLFKSFFLGRLFVVFYFSLTVFALCLQKILMHFLLKLARLHGKNFRNALVVGTTDKTRAFLERNQEHPEIGLKVLGVIDHKSPSQHHLFMGLPVYGDFNAIPALMQTLPLDYIFFLVPKHCLNEIEPLIKLCETHGITTSVSAYFFNLDRACSHSETIFDFPMITFKTTPIAAGQLFAKRVLDILLSSLALLALAPVFLALVLAVRLSSPGPVFFRQRRCTLNGRNFVLYKFRTMSADAEQQLEGLRAFNEMEGPAFKMEKDPRITPMGRWLRKFSLDELPQLWNVLHGDMSLVGPRPPLPEEVEKYHAWQRRKLSMRSGLTCLWQVNGRNQIKDFDEWTRLDLAYIDNWSIKLDFKILLKTFWAVFSQAGAK